MSSVLSLSSRFRARQSFIWSLFRSLASSHSSGLISLYLSSRGLRKDSSKNQLINADSTVLVNPDPWTRAKACP